MYVDSVNVFMHNILLRCSTALYVRAHNMPLPSLPRWWHVLLQEPHCWKVVTQEVMAPVLDKMKEHLIGKNMAAS